MQFWYLGKAALPSTTAACAHPQYLSLVPYGGDLPYRSDALIGYTEHRTEKVLQAVYKGGVLHSFEAMPLEENQQVTLTITEPMTAGQDMATEEREHHG